MKATWNSSLAELIVAQVSCGLSTEFYGFQFVCIEGLLAEKSCSGRGGDIASTFSIILCWVFVWLVLIGELERALMNYCWKYLCFCHRGSIILPAQHVYDLPLKFSSELPAVKTHSTTVTRNWQSDDSWHHKWVAQRVLLKKNVYLSHAIPYVWSRILHVVG